MSINISHFYILCRHSLIAQRMVNYSCGGETQVGNLVLEKVTVTFYLWSSSFFLLALVVWESNALKTEIIENRSMMLHKETYIEHCSSSIISIVYNGFLSLSKKFYFLTHFQLYWISISLRLSTWKIHLYHFHI